MTATPTLSTIASFTGSDGANPVDGLTIDANGDLFGITSQGGPDGIGPDGIGPDGSGTVFEIAAGSQSITTLASFTGSNATTPVSTPISDANGDLFGTTSQGGADSAGTVYEIAAGTTSPVTLVSFTGDNGANPGAGLVSDANGNLFGITSQGGAGGDGTVFEVVNAGFATTPTPPAAPPLVVTPTIVTPTPAPAPDFGPTLAFGTYAATVGAAVDLTSELNALITPGAVGDTETIASFDLNLVQNSAGAWIYTAPDMASDNALFTVTDQNGHTAIGQVAITLSSAATITDPGPSVTDGTASVVAGSTTDLTSVIDSLITPGLAGDRETITPLDPNLVADANGDLIYTAPATATDNVAFNVTDQNGTSALGLVAVTITPAPSDAPASGSSSLTFSSYDSHFSQAAGDDTALTITDTVGGSGAAAGAFFALNNGNNTLLLGGSFDNVTLGSGYSDVSGSGGNLILTASGADDVTAGGYANQITLGAGDSIVDAGLGYSTISVGDTSATGETTITASGNDNTITTAGGSDIVTLTGAGWNNIINAGPGATTVTGGYGNTYNVTALPDVGSGLTVTDFNAAYGDVLNLAPLEAGLPPGFTIGGTNTGAAFDVTLTTGGSTYTVAVLGGVGSDISLASLQASHSILG